jgi:hypothetical protein
MNSSSNVIWKIDENSGKKRLPYVLMLLLGIFFWVASISTFYALYQQMSFQDWSVDVYSRAFLLPCFYIILNFIAGYGFLFCRKWIITVFLFNAILMGAISALFYFSRGIILQAALTASFISFVASGITLSLRKYLVPTKRNFFVVISYVLILLVTVYMNYFFGI